MATDDELAAIAAQLYAAPLGEFTAARTARVKAARDDGDRDLAARIGALPKPSASAWLVDLLAREHTDDLDRIEDLGARLRAAQEDPDRASLRELGGERRALIAEVAGIAADRSEQTGRRASAAVVEEIQRTLQAAMSDEDAAAAVRSGRLVRALAAEGLDPVDLTNAVAVGGRLDAAQRATRAPATRTPAAAEPDEDAAARREAEARATDTARAAKHARREADDLASAADDAETTAQERTDAAADLRERIEDLQHRLEAAESDRAAARESAESARRAAGEASDAADAAQREADDADATLRRLRTR